MIAVIVIVVGGIFFVTSTGDSAKIARGKEYDYLWCSRLGCCATCVCDCKLCA